MADKDTAIKEVCEKLEQLGVTGVRKTLFFRLLEFFKFAGSHSSTTRVTLHHLGTIFSCYLMDIPIGTTEPVAFVSDSHTAKTILLFLIENDEQVKACAYSEEAKGRT